MVSDLLKVVSYYTIEKNQMPKIEKWGRWSKLTCLYICVNMGNLVEKFSTV